MDIKKIRAETPGIETAIHFNNAGASLMPRRVFREMTDYLEEELLNGGYETAEKNSGKIQRSYSHIATLVGADPSEIALLENATAAWNMAFFSIPFEKGDRILTSVSEYASNYLGYLRLREDHEISIEVIPNDNYGQTSPKALSDMLDDRVKLVSITHIPTNSGLVNSAEEIGRLLQSHPCFYLLDACQSVGQYPVEVDRIGCDMLSATGRKYLRGPRGTGFLYVSESVLGRLHPPFIDLHSAEWTSRETYTLRNDARRFENWEFNYAGVVGMSEAACYALELGMENIWKRIQYLGALLREELSRIPGIEIHDLGSTKGGIVTFMSDSVKPADLKEKMAMEQIHVSTSAKNATLIDMERSNLDELVRASVHYFNTEDEISRFGDRLSNMITH